MPQPLEVLLVENLADDANSVEQVLRRAGYAPRITRVETEAAMRDALGSGAWDVILSDCSLPRLSCEAALLLLKESGRDIPFIALSGTVDEETILKIVRAGAGDYVMKNNLARLPAAVGREIRDAWGRRQRARLENQLQQAMKMEAIGRLAGGVAHDFNNLLTVITGFAQLALMEENPARAGLEQIMLAAERASGLTRQLLAFSRQQALDPHIFDLNRLVAEMEKMLKRLIGEDIEVITRLDPEVLTVRADPGQIEQVILNLAVNSRDAMPKGGKLVLRTFPAAIEGNAAVDSGLPEGSYRGVSVTDTGSGIPDTVLPHIFEPFFSTKPEGNGLGLSTAYGIVKQSGGAIQASNGNGGGTTMTVLLPSSGSATDIAQSSYAEPVGTGKETVLVAEDDATVLNLVAHCLRARGFRVLSAPDGESALGLLHAQGPAGVDLLITDVVMPGIAGPVLAARATELIPRLRVLFMSGYTEEVIRHHGISRRNATFLQKPFAPSELVRKVRQLLDGEPAGNPAAGATLPRAGE